MIKVNDTVKFKIRHSNTTLSHNGVVLAIHGDRAWVQFPDHVVPLSPLLSHIEKVV